MLVPVLACFGPTGALGQAFDTIHTEKMTRIDRIWWLAGCWTGGTGGRSVEEHWMGGAKGLMLGMGRTVDWNEDRLVEYEHTMIQVHGDTLVFTATPSGQPTASFTEIELTDSLVTFENKDHYFPQRVGYHLLPDGGLNAWIEGRRYGKLRHIDFPYQRVDCSGSAK
jgi:hypothetical protein